MRALRRNYMPHAALRAVPSTASGITFLASNSVGADALALPTHLGGNFIIRWAGRNVDDTGIIVPSGLGWITIAAATGGVANYTTAAYKFAASSSENGGTWTNATALVTHVYSGVDTSTPILDADKFEGTGGSMVWPALTMATSGWVMIAARSLNDVTEAIPVPFTTREIAARRMSGDTGPVSSFAGASQTLAAGGSTVGACFALKSSVPGVDPPPAGTLYPNSVASINMDMIFASDPSAFVSAPYLGFLVREVPNAGNINVHVFGATFTDCPNTIEMYMTTNPVDGSTYANQAAAQVDVDRYTPRLGKLPLVYRRNIHHMIGYAGNGVDTSGETLTSEDAGHFFMIFADRATTRIGNNDLEESFFHEASHASIQKHGTVDGLTLDDFDCLASPEWAAAKAADGATGFITDYAMTQDQEDFAEHALFAYTMIFHPERIPEPDRTWIAAKIPNRIAFFRTIFETTF